MAGYFGRNRARRFSWVVGEAQLCVCVRKGKAFFFRGFFDFKGSNAALNRQRISPVQGGFGPEVGSPTILWVIRPRGRDQDDGALFSRAKFWGFR